MQILAGLCLCLVLVTSSVQAMHIHRPAQAVSQPELSTSGGTQANADTDAACPLCAGFHHVLHLRPLGSAAVSLCSTELVAVQELQSPGTQRTFGLFTRPPPALL